MLPTFGQCIHTQMQIHPRLVRRECICPGVPPCLFSTVLAHRTSVGFDQAAIQVADPTRNAGRGAALRPETPNQPKYQGFEERSFSKIV